MSQKDRRRWRWSVGLGAGLLLGNWAYGAEPPPPPQLGSALHTAIPVTIVTLDDCLRYAYDHQPNLIAARDSLAAAETQLKSLCDLHNVPLLPGSRELPIRRQQASLGVCIAQAALGQAEQDTAYSVRRTYLAYQYARAQVQVAQELVDRMAQYNIREDQLEEEDTRVSVRYDSGRVAIYYRLARSRLEEARSGVERSRAALREAIGACPDLGLQPADEGWFVVKRKQGPPLTAFTLCEADVVKLALDRRGEIGQTAILGDVHRLEVDAQAKTCFLPSVRTFAAGADLHSRTVPAPFDDGAMIYRPGALAPEMPSLLVGPKCDREERAQNLSERACAVAEKTSNLIVLEAEDAYWRWTESRARVVETNRAARAALVLKDPEVEKDLLGSQKQTEVVPNLVFAAEALAKYNDALYQHLMSLAVLERVTAGGIASGLGSLPTGSANCLPSSAPGQ